MNEQAIKDGYDYFVQTGYKGTLEDYIQLMATNPNAVKDTYTYFQETGYRGSEEDFNILFGLNQSVKKKDTPMVTPEVTDGTGETEITEEVLQEEEGVPSMSAGLPEDDLIPRAQEVRPYSPIGSETNFEDLSVGEKDTLLERTFGKTVVTDLFGDMYRSFMQGQAQGGSVDESLELLGKSRVGADITSEDIQDFIAAQKRMQAAGVSDEMKDFNRIYQESGGGAWGWVKGVVANPTTIPQLFVSSVSAMLNPTVLAGAGAGAAIGSAATPIGTAVGFFAGAGITLETGLTFAELLQKEVQEKGLKFDEEGVRQVLEDRGSMSQIRTRAAARGAVIGAIDGIASKVGIKVGAKVLGGKAYGVGTKLKAAGAVIGTEAVGGSTGEVAGRLAAGQEMDAAEILFEGVAGTATAPLTLGIAAYKAPKYYVNISKFNENEKDIARVTPEEMNEMVYESSDADFMNMELTIKNNPKLNQDMKNRRDKIYSKGAAQKQILDANPNISQEKLNKLVPLQEELNKLENNQSQPAKRRKKEIVAQMNQIEDGSAEVEIEVTTEEARKSLETDNELSMEMRKQGRPGPDMVIINDASIEERRQKLIREKQGQKKDVKEAPASPEVQQEAKDLDQAVKIDTDETTDITETTEVTEEQKNYDKRLKQRNSSIKKVNPNFKTKGPKVGKRYAGGEIVEVQSTRDHESYNAERDGDGYTVYTRINEYAEFTDGKQTKRAKVETMRFKDKKTADKYIADQYQYVVDKTNENVRKAQEKLDKSKEGVQATQEEKVTEVNQAGNIFNNQLTEGETKVKNITDIQVVETSNPEVNKGKVSVSGQFSKGYESIVGDPKLNKDRRNVVTKKSKVKDGVRIEEDVDLVFDEYTLPDGGKVFSLVNPNHRDSAGRPGVYGVNLTYDANSNVTLNDVKDVLINKMNKITSEVTGVETKTTQDATTQQSTTQVDGQKQTQPVQDVSKRDTRRKQSTRKKQGQQNENTKKAETQAKVGKLSAIGPNLYVNRTKPDATNYIGGMFVKPAKRALAVLKKILPDTIVVIHETNEAYQKATNTEGKPSRGLFNPNNNVIHINAELATKRTLAHEIFHALLKNKLGSETRIAALSNRMLQALKKADLDPEVRQSIEKYLEQYNKINKGNEARLAFAAEEYMAEVFAFIANNYTQLKAPEQSIIKRFLSKVSNLLGLTAEDVIATDEALIDLVNNVAQKLAAGETVLESDIKALDDFKGGKKVKNPASALKTQIVGGFEVSYTQQDSIAEMIKKGLVTEPKDVSFLEGNETVITAPDDMLAGEIKYNGKVIFEGEGGVFFVTKFGDVWASGNKGTANNIAKNLNKQLETNGGKAYLTLTKGSDAKLVSSASGVNSTLAILNTMLDNKLITPSNFRSAVSAAVRSAGGTINLRQSAKDLKTDIQKYFTNPKTSTFEKRGDVVRDIVGEIAKNLPKEDRSAIINFLDGNPNKSLAKKTSATANGLVDLIARIAAEQLTKGLNTGDVYAVIEINSPVEVKEDSHPSYPFHISIKDGGKPILHLPQNRQSGSEVLIQKSGVEYKVRNVSIVEGRYKSKSEVKTQIITESQNNADIIFQKSDSINDVVAKARGRDYSDAAIYEYLRNNRKLSVDEARAALETKGQDMAGMPFEFGTVEGGINEGQTLYNEITYELNKYIAENPDATPIQIAKKGLEILRNNDIFKKQPDITKAELEISYDGVLNKVKSKSIRRRIARLKRDLFIRKKGQRDLRRIQLQLNKLLKTYLPKEAQLSKTELTRLINEIAKATPDSILSVGNKIFDVIGRQRNKLKQKRIKEIKDLVRKQAQGTAPKQKATNLEAQGKQFFKDILEVVMAVTKSDKQEADGFTPRQKALLKIANEIKAKEKETNIALEKQKRGEKLTVQEVSLINKVLAYDTFANLQSLELEAVEGVLKQLKDTKKASIALLNMSRLERAEINNSLSQQAINQIRENYPMLFNEDGTLKNENDLAQDENQRSLGPFRKRLAKWWETYPLTKGIGIANYFRNRMSHLGTLMNLLDNVAKKNTFFYENVYLALNRMHTKALRGYYNQMENLNSIAASIDGIDDYADLKTKIPQDLVELKVEGRKDPKTFSIDQLMRIYALSKNPVQRKKLLKNGIGETQLSIIEDEIGPIAIEFVDKIVDYLSNSYFESINDVYVQNNYVNLNPVENYFPTRSVSKEDVSKDLIAGNFSKVFNAETAPALKDRSDTEGEISENETFTAALENHVTQMERFKAYAPGVKNLTAIFNTPAVNTLMKELGIEQTVYRAINLAINPNAGAVAPDWIGRLLSKFTGFALSFKAVQLVKQATSFVNAYEDFPGIKGSKIPKPVQFIFGMTKILANLPKYMDLAKQISPDFTDRVRKGLDGDIYRLETGSRTVKPVEKRTAGKDREAQINRFVKLFKQAAASPTVMGDILGVMGYMINYEANIENGMSKAEAAAAFNEYNATQQSRRGTDKIPIQQNQDNLSRAFTMFGSTLFLQINKVLQAQVNIMRSLGEGKGVKGRISNVRSKDIKSIALNYAGANVMFALAANMAKLLKGNDEDEEVVMERLKDALYGLNLLYQIPLIGGAAEEVINKAKGRPGYGDDVVNPYKSVFRKISKATQEGSSVKGLQPLVEIIIGAQVDPFVGVYNAFAGDTEEQSKAIYDILGISPSYQPSLGMSFSSEDMQYIKKTDPDLYKLLQEQKRSKSKNKLMPKSQMKRENPELYYSLYGDE